MKSFFVVHFSCNRDYLSHWSSLEKAIEKMPNDWRFKRAIQYFKPHFSDPDKSVKVEEDWSVNESVKPVLSLSENGRINISWPGYTFKRYREEVVPEVKVEGQPYKPSVVNKVYLTPIVLDNTPTRYIEAEEILLDEVQHSS